MRIFLDQPLKQWLTGEKRREDENTKIWISRERKELFRWNKKHFSQFFKGYHLVKNKNLIENSGHSFNKFAMCQFAVCRKNIYRFNFSIVKKITLNFWSSSPILKILICGISSSARYLKKVIKPLMPGHTNWNRLDVKRCRFV